MPEEKSTSRIDPYKARRHNVYAPGWVMSAIDKLAEINRPLNRKGQNRSQIIVNELKKLLRVNAPRLRKAGVQLPDEQFEKESRAGWQKRPFRRTPVRAQ